MQPSADYHLSKCEHNSGHPIELTTMTVAYSRPMNLGNLLSSRNLHLTTAPPVSSYRKWYKWRPRARARVRETFGLRPSVHHTPYDTLFFVRHKYFHFNFLYVLVITPLRAIPCTNIILSVAYWCVVQWWLWFLCCDFTHISPYISHNDIPVRQLPLSFAKFLLWSG